MQVSERLEFAYGGQTGYFIITREAMSRKGDSIGLIMVSAPPGTLALKKKKPELRVDAQVLWQRNWQPAIIQEVAENMLEAAKEKDGAEPHSVEFVGEVNNGKLVVQRKKAGVNFSEQFPAGIGAEFALSVKDTKKLAKVILDIELPVEEVAEEVAAEV